MQSNQPFRATHTAPAAGMATWAAPGNPTTGPRLDPNLPVQLVQVYGDWAQIMCSNGWSAWVDGRHLVPVGAPAQTPGPAPFPVGGVPVPPLATPVRAAGPYKFVTPNAASWPTSAGAALLVLSTFLPWIDFGQGSKSVNALDVPFVFLFGWKKSGDGGPGLGLVLIVLALAAFGLRHVRGLEKMSRIPAALAIPAVVMFIVQMNSYLGAVKDTGADNVPGLFSVLGLGVWPALIGAGLLTWGGNDR